MSLENTLLAIKREYSKDEKFKLFLKHLDNVENELRIERKKNTNFLKKTKELEALIESLQEEIKFLQETLDEYKGTGDQKKFVNMKAHNKIIKKKEEFEKLFWDLYHEHKKLKEELLNQNKIPVRDIPDIHTSDDVNML